MSNFFFEHKGPLTIPVTNVNNNISSTTGDSTTYYKLACTPWPNTLSSSDLPEHAGDVNLVDFPAAPKSGHNYYLLYNSHHSATGTHRLLVNFVTDYEGYNSGNTTYTAMIYYAEEVPFGGYPIYKAIVEASSVPHTDSSIEGTTSHYAPTPSDGDVYALNFHVTDGGLLIVGVVETEGGEF